MSIQTITVRELQQRMENELPPKLIDVRTPAEYRQLHAQGAQNIPLDRIDPSELRAGCNRADETIFVICQSGSRSAKACEKLTAAGLTKVYSVDGGTSAWKEAGLSVEWSSTHGISLERQVRIAAGSMVFTGAVLAWAIHPAFLAIPLFVGAGLVFAGITDYCGMGLLLARMPWNN